MITEAEVHHACDCLNLRGEEPKYEAIRAELGNRGSWSTIKRYRQSWIAKEQEVPPVPDALHAHVAAEATAVWRCAYPLAAASFGEERRAAAAEIAELTTALENTVTDRDAQAAAVAALTAAGDELRARLAATEASRQVEAERHAALAGEFAALTALTTQLQASLGARSESAKALRVVGESARDERAS